MLKTRVQNQTSSETTKGGIQNSAFTGVVCSGKGRLRCLQRLTAQCRTLILARLLALSITSAFFGDNIIDVMTPLRKWEIVDRIDHLCSEFDSVKDTHTLECSQAGEYTYGQW